MLVQLNTDSNIEAGGALAQEVESLVTDSLDRFSDRLTRVEVHLSDVNSHKGGDDDKRCVLEARPKGRDPVSAAHQAPTIQLAVDGAAQKLKRSLDSTFGKLDRR